MPNNFVIDCVSSVVQACLNVLNLHNILLETFLSRACVGVIVLARGGGGGRGDQIALGL